MFRCWRVILFVSLCASAVVANWNDTSTGIDLNKLRPFLLTKIRSGWLKEGSRVSFDGISATDGGAYDRQVRLRATSKSGKPWEVHMCCLDEIWRGDLDGNGTLDYVLFASGPYFNGRLTPLFSLAILLMDRDEMPVPFFTVVYKGEKGAGIKYLVDLNHDGRAELLISDYDEIPSDPKVGAFCSGHWTNQLYRFRDFGAEEIRGMTGGINFPFIHDWTYRGTECAEEATPIFSAQPPTIYDHGTSRRGNAITKIRQTKAATSVLGNDVLAIDAVAGCNAITASVIVYDRRDRREIAFPNQFAAYSADLADRIRRDAAPAELRGINKQTGSECSVNLLWANQPGDPR
jgi:hypothetical protein